MLCICLQLSIYVTNQPYLWSIWPSFSHGQVILMTCIQHVYNINTSRTTWKYCHVYRVSKARPRGHMLVTYWSKNALLRNLPGGSCCPDEWLKWDHVRVLVGPQSELSLRRSYPAGGEIVTTCIVLVEFTSGYICQVVKVNACTEKVDNTLSWHCMNIFAI